MIAVAACVRDELEKQRMGNRDKGFTLVEILVVVAIIGMLVGLIMPALNRARIAAKVAAQKSAINALGTGVEAWRNNYGYYPPSWPSYNTGLNTGGSGDIVAGWRDTGAHMLVQYLLGIDLLGYSRDRNYYIHPTGDMASRDDHYVPVDDMMVMNFRAMTAMTVVEQQMARRKLGFVHDDLWPNMNPVFIDIFTSKRPRAILYYRANPRENLIGRIYNYGDNYEITDPCDTGGVGNNVYNNFISINRLNANAYLPAKMTGGGYDDGTFEHYLWNPVTSDVSTNVIGRPFNRDTFVLISAGPDGYYGVNPQTGRCDDVTNFDRGGREVGVGP